MKSYLELIPISEKQQKNQGKMTLICIVLSVFLVTAIFGMVEMAMRSQQYQEIKIGGNWHVIFSDIDQKTGELIQNRPEVKCSSWYGYVKETHGFSVGGKPIGIAGIDGQAYASMFEHELVEGNFPTSDHEIVLSESAKPILKVELGDAITVDGMGETFTISGFAAASSKQMRYDRFSALLSIETFRRHVPAKDYTEQLVVQLSAFCNMQKVIADITQTFHLGEKQVAKNGNLLIVMGQSDDDFVIQLYGCAVVLFFLVLTASVLMITSSLNSNVARRIEFFGMLRCVGATKRQIMRFVRREGLRWCKYAIPVGLAGGVVTVWILCAALKWISPVYFSEMPVFRVSGISVVCGIAVGFLTVLLAAQSPARKAAGVSPLMAVSGNAYQTKPIRAAANTHLFKIEASLGIHHATSNRKNFILMTCSFAISIILFLAFSPAIDFMSHAINAVEPYTPDISIISKDNSLSVPKELAEQFENLDYVKQAYGRMFAYDIPVEGDRQINLITYEEQQFKWAEENLIEGSVEKAVSTNNAVLVVYNSGYVLHTGDKISLNINSISQELEVVGILSKSPFSNTPGTANIICTEDTFQKLFGEAQYTIMDLQLGRGATNEDVNVIREMAGTEFTFSDRRQSNQQAVGSYYSYALFIYGFLVVIALITVFNVINSISMSVSARIKQYGAMRAIGMSSRQLVKMIMTEAATYSFVGSLTGCLVGLPVHKYLFEHMVTGRWGDPWRIPVPVLAIMVLLVVITALIAVRGPARRIHNMSVIDTISAQ
ncbi:hypothetical protein IMSAGC007_03916 [Lachnospiraceae bacterium]|uniref:ABC transporter permease n=1 Tax=Candidatus Merdisoma sp. JLR.KK011 TaxID=3114299 RepID=UPI0014353FF7|nr:hypothetical protein IMSAGC007_03916 [Lachnospiraceae bacterium]